MSKVLVVRKTDRTVHVVPLDNKAALMGLNLRLPITHKLKIEEMEEMEALKLPFFDKNYVSPTQAQNKLKEAESELQEKDLKIAELEEKLNILLSQQATEDPSKSLTAARTIEEINKIETIEGVKAYLEGETRITVINAINRRIAELETK